MTTGAELKGMTVNERLVHLGLMLAFDEAVRSRKPEVVVSVLRQAHFTLSQAQETTTAVLAKPKYYGY